MKRRVHVVFVEDINSIAQVLVVGLDFFGITVDPVYRTGEQFLNQYNEPTTAGIDMFIFDIRLPKLSGVEIARRLREMGDKRPIALVSAWAPPPKKDLEELDAVYLSKPFNIRELAGQIHTMVGSG